VLKSIMIPTATLGKACLMACVLAGCSLAPTYERPALPVADAWPQMPQPGTQVAAGTVLDWQSFVGDARLRGLIETALANNRDLRQALLNIQAARAIYGVQRAEGLPTVQVQAGGTRERLPADVRAPGTPLVQSDYQAGVGLASFEIDAFGRLRNLTDAALQAYLATEDAARTAQISLVGEVIHTYLERNGAQQRLLLARKTLDARKAGLKLIELRRHAGAAADLDYQEALGLVQQVLVQLEQIDRELRQDSNALALLVGVADVAPMLPASPEDNVMLVQDLAPGVPSDLLVHRPDIQEAEHGLKARNADIGAARAAFFPRISLTGMFGGSSAELHNLFDSGQRTWSFTPQLVLPIFDGGRNRANLDAARVRKDMAVAAYEHTIQAAFRDVADALAATDTLRRQESAQEALAQSSAATLRLSDLRYRTGTDDYLHYLDAQRSDLANQMALIDVRTQRQVALVGLFRALGGGWQPTVPSGTVVPAVYDRLGMK
jgi:multidrug efflux system outer membrane protein